MNKNNIISSIEEFVAKIKSKYNYLYFNYKHPNKNGSVYLDVYGKPNKNNERKYLFTLRLSDHMLNSGNMLGCGVINEIPIYIDTDEITHIETEVFEYYLRQFSALNNLN